MFCGITGILLAQIQMESCQQGLSVFQSKNLKGMELKLDAAYPLAARLKLATGSESCYASDQAVSKAQLLLRKLHFDAKGSYLGYPLANKDLETTWNLEEQLTGYNSGALCLP